MHESDWTLSTHEKQTLVGKSVSLLLAAICTKGQSILPSHTIGEKQHLPTKPGDLCAVDLNGGLPTSRSGVKYILVFE